MPLYNEENITGTIDLTRYEHAHRVTLDNTLNVLPSISFHTSTVERDNTSGKETVIGYFRVLAEPYTPGETFDYTAPDGTPAQSDYDTYLAMTYGIFYKVAQKADAV